MTLLALVFLALPGSVPEAREPDRWLEARSPHFVVISNAGEKRVRGVSERLERVRALLRRVLTHARVDPRDPVVVMAVNNERSLRELLPQFWERKGQRGSMKGSPSSGPLVLVQGLISNFCGLTRFTGAG